MRIAIACICFILLFGCKKESVKSEMVELNGSWELRKAKYGYSTTPEVLFAQGNRNIITFSGNHKYSRTDVENATTNTVSGTYKVVHSVNCRSEDIATITFSDNYINSGSILVVSGDSLFFKNNNCVLEDGVDRVYVKVN